MKLAGIKTRSKKFFWCIELALPLIIFFFLTIVGVALFVFGLTRASLGAGFSFTALSGVFFILTGLLLWTSGLQLDSTSSMVTSGSTTTITYQTMTFAANPEIMLLSYFFLFGGFFPIVLSLRNAFVFKQNARQEAIDSEY